MFAFVQPFAGKCDWKLKLCVEEKYLSKRRGRFMLQSVLNVLFSCGHQRTTFPITPGRRPAGSTPTTSTAATYVVCLDCGKQFAYDWKAMRVGDQMVVPVANPEVQPIYR